MSTENKSGCIIGLVLLITLSVLGVGGWYVKKEYAAAQKAVASEIATLPKFDSESMAKKLAKNKGWTYPVPLPTLTPEEIEKQARKKADELTKKIYNLKNYARQQAEIIKKYRTAKFGDRISFIMNTTGKTVSGKFRGIEKDYKGELVKVGLSKYRLHDIMPDFHYLFVPEIATMRAEQELKKFKTEYKKNKKELFSKNYKNTLSQLYNKSGYINDSGAWTPKSDYIKDQVADAEKKFDKEQKKKKKKIYEQHKIFGLINVSLPAEKTEKETKKQSPDKSTQ